MAKEELEASDKNVMEWNGKILRKNAEGIVGVMSKDAYQSQLNSTHMTSAKKNENMKQWMETAQKQYRLLAKMMEDPNTDELDKEAIQNKMDTIHADYSKYLAYGKNFTKPKAGKKLPKVKISTAEIFDVPTLKLSSVAAKEESAPKLNFARITPKQRLRIGKIKFNPIRSSVTQGKRLA